MISDCEEIDLLLAVSDDTAYQSLKEEFESEGARLRIFRVNTVPSLIQTLKDSTEVPLPDFQPRIVLLDALRWEEEALLFLKERALDPVIRKIPVVVLAPNGDNEWVQNIYLSGATSVISRPSSPDHYSSILDALKSYWFGIVKLPTPV